MPCTVSRRDADDGAHVLLHDGSRVHQLWIKRHVSEDTPMTALLPLQPHVSTRAEATLRFWRLIAHGPARHCAKPCHHHERLVQALQALDGHRTGANYRQIAEALFSAERVAEKVWKEHSLRDTTIRLVRTGLAMMEGGYHKLLESRHFT